MPVEIKELIIRTNIVSNPQNDGRQGKGMEPIERRQLVDDCVNKVIRIMSKKSER